MEELFLKILNMSITATYVLLAVLVLRLILKRAPKWISYALWSLVLFRLVCPISISSTLSVFGRIGKTTSTGGGMEHIPVDISMAAIPQVDIGTTGMNAATPAASANPMQTLIFIGTCIWLAAIGVMLIYSVVSYLRLKHSMMDATLVSGNIYETDNISSPFVCGLIKPKIYLPIGLSGNEREYVLRHEQTHISRRDYIIKPLAFLVLSVHWFNPFMWLAFILMSRDLEMSCDEKVVSGLDSEGKVGYSSVLIQLAMKRPIFAGSPVAFGESGAKGRIKNVLNYKKPAFWVLIAAVAVVIVSTACLLTNPAKTLTANSFTTVSQHPKATEWASFMDSSFDSMTVLDLRTGTETTYNDYEKILSIIDAIKNMEISEQPEKEQVKPGGFTYNITLANASDTVLITVPYFSVSNEEYDSAIYIAKDTGKVISDIENILERKEATVPNGIEIFIWKDNNQIKFSVFQGIGTPRTEDDIYNGSMVFSDIADVNNALEAYRTDYMQISIRQMKIVDFTKSEMESLADRLKVPTGNYSVGIGGYVPEDTDAIETSDTGIRTIEGVTYTNDLDEAVKLALLQKNQGRYFRGECSGEGHIILGQKEEFDITTVYALTMYGEYGFENGNFTKVSGSGIIPAVFTFTNSENGFACTKMEEPEDGARYGDSIRRLFPPEYLDRVLSPTNNDSQDLKSQERSYASGYLKKIGRNAEIGNYGDFEHILLNDVGVSVEVSNSINDKQYANYPYWIGNREALENGIRYVYEMSYNEKEHEIVFMKYEYDTKKTVELIRLDSITGAQLPD